MAENRRAANGTDEIYVGYLPTPTGYRRFLRSAVPALFVLFLVLCGLWVSAAKSPGDGVWNVQEPQQFMGWVNARPYAMLRAADADAPDGYVTMLLVSEGKRGAADVAANRDGELCAARGTVLERDGRRLLELGEDGLTPLKHRPTDRPDFPVKPLGDASLRGEIIDPKCYFGAMKPGEGKTHKECATLCISGGIPPMFVVRGPGGQRSYYLLTDSVGGPANELVLPFIGEPVEIRGQLERWGDLRALKLSEAGIRRL